MLRLLTDATTDSTGSSLTEPAAKQLNALQKWWQNIDWEAIVGILIQKVLMLLFLIILFGILLKISNYVIERIYRSYEKKGTYNASRINTIHALIRNIVHYTLGAGIAGVALGLGAQGFMNDLITGFFIITEQQINVGDYIRLTNLSLEGTVTAVGIRTVQLKSVDGTVHYIPNRNITTISNTSRANMQVVVDVRILPSEGLDDIRSIIDEVNQTVAAAHEEEIQTKPAIFGVVDLGNNNFAIRTTMYVTNGTQWKLKEEFLAASIDALTAKGYTIPSAPIIGVN